MPNWCFNCERIIGPRSEIVPFLEKLREWTRRNYRKNDFGHGWLGNIVLGAGFKVDGENGLYCRGVLVDAPELCDEDEETLWISFSSQTAWCPVRKMWEEVLKRHAPNCKYIFCSGEPGMGYYAKNDRDGSFFPEDFFVDCCVEHPDLAPKGIEEIAGDMDETTVRKFLQGFLHTDSEDTDALVEQFHGMGDNGMFGEGNFIRIHHYEIVD